MKKFISILLCSVLLLFSVLLSGCTMADTIKEGTYVCKTPYIKFIYVYGLDYTVAYPEIEIDRKVYKAFTHTGYDATIEFVEYQEEDINGSGVSNDNKSYAMFDYRFNDKKNQLILTDQKTGNVYHLDKVE